MPQPIPCGAVVNCAKTARRGIQPRPGWPARLNCERSRRRRVSKLGFCWLGYQSNRIATPMLYISQGMNIPSDILVQLGQVGTLILGSLGVWVAMFNQRRQLNAQIFIEMSRRFQDVLRMFPTEAWLANRNPSAPLPPPSQEITDCTMYCIQLIADVYHLRQGRYISRRLWS